MHTPPHIHWEVNISSAFSGTSQKTVGSRFRYSRQILLVRIQPLTAGVSGDLQPFPMPLLPLPKLSPPSTPLPRPLTYPPTPPMGVLGTRNRVKSNAKEGVFRQQGLAWDLTPLWTGVSSLPLAWKFWEQPFEAYVSKLLPEVQLWTLPCCFESPRPPQDWVPGIGERRQASLGQRLPTTMLEKARPLPPPSPPLHPSPKPRPGPLGHPDLAESAAPHAGHSCVAQSEYPGPCDNTCCPL